MKKIILTSALIIFGVVGYFGFGQWAQLNGPQGGEANCVTWVGNQIWVGTDNGVYTSANNGQTWQHSQVAAGKACNSIIVFGGDTIVIGYHLFPDYYILSGSNIDTLYTIVSFNGGANWSVPAVAEGGDLYFFIPNIKRVRHSLYFQDINNGSFTSFDYGVSWVPMATAIGDLPPDNLMSDSNYVFGVYYDPNLQTDYVLRSLDGLYNWQFIDSAYHNTFADLSLIVTVSDSTVLQIMTDSAFQFSILRSTNLGTTWNTVYNTSNKLAALYQFDGKYYCRDAYGAGLASIDGGLTWNTVTLPKYAWNSLNNIRLSPGLFMQARVTGPDIYTSATDTFAIVNKGLIARPVNSLVTNGNSLFAISDDIYTSHDNGFIWNGTGLGLSNTSSLLAAGDTLFALKGVNAQHGLVIRSLNNGQTWDTTGLSLSPAGATERLTTPIRFNNRIIIVDGSLWYSDNFGNTWDTLPSVPNVVLNGFSAKLTVIGNDLI
ncbi:MAG: BNR/Asp-box repeat protein [Bacteroidota bacterium]|nr:BNR/Asp-box repeat protein [Bacteroidota bacterium]